MTRQLFTLAILLFSFSSCKWLYPNYLLRDTKDFKYIEIIETEVEHQKQVILPGDQISFALYTRDGYSLIDVLGGGSSGGGTRGGSGGFLVKEDGYVELPLLGEFYVKGYTRLELEHILEEKYSVWYNDPFMQLSVTNSRAFIFTGVGGASSYSLPKENTTLIELLAGIGGIPLDAKAYKIRIIRGDYDNPSIKLIDFSTIAGLKDADFIILPNDIIFIDSKLRPGEAFGREVSFFFSFVSTLTTIYLLVFSITRL